MNDAALSLGSNLTNDRGALMRAACRALSAAGVRVVSRSPVVETEPMGVSPGQGLYLNQVIGVRTELDAVGLLSVCQEVEASLGRRRRQRWGARTIDIDILTFGGARISTPLLTVPHPGVESRPFVARLMRARDAQGAR